MINVTLALGATNSPEYDCIKQEGNGPTDQRATMVGALFLFLASLILIFFI